MTARRRRIALGLAVGSLAAAVVGAVGPADEVRSSYSWPPRALSGEQPTQLWLAPLLLIRYEPESLHASIPCTLPPPLRSASRPATVIATARLPDTPDALTIVDAGGRLLVEFGDTLLATLDLAESTAAGQDCAYELEVVGDRWSIEGGPDGVALEGALERMPVVTGFSSALDLRSGPGPSIDVTTAVHRVYPTALQAASWLIAALALCAALALVAGAHRPRRGSVRRTLARARASGHSTDAVVVVMLCTWWVLAPVVWDDGWIVARERAYSASGGFSTFYTTLGVNLPLDYWVEWAHHWIAGSSNVLLLRLPVVVCLLALWLLCRAVVSIVAPGPQARATSWTLAAGFLIFAVAWGMTLRPEPVTALLATAVLLCVVLFARDGRTAPLVAMAVLVPLALTAHTTGGVALAPLLAISPRLLRWARSNVAAAATVLASSAALFLVLYTVGSDASQRLADARTTSQYGITSSWRAEYERYQTLNDFPWAAPIRNASVTLIALALLMFVLRRRAGGRPLMSIPAASLALGLVTLLLTSSKIPWHFGALIGIACIALAVEVARLTDEAWHARSWWKPVLLVGAATVAASYFWELTGSWNPADLRTVTWSAGTSGPVSPRDVAVALPVIALVVAVVIGLRRRGGRQATAAAWSIATWLVPILAVPVVAFTVGVLLVDTARTDGWTLARQNLGSAAGRAHCGLADDLAVVPWSSVRTLLPRRSEGAAPPSPTIPPPPLAGLARYELRPGATTPWFDLPRAVPFGTFVAGPRDAMQQLAYEWRDAGTVQQAPLDVPRADGLPLTFETTPWSLVTVPDPPLPASEGETVAVRFRLKGDAADPVAMTAPVAYRATALTGLTGPDAKTLVHPNLVLYFPCAKQPVLERGTVEAPAYVVWFDHWYQPYPSEESSPFRGLRDLYDIRRLPLEGVDVPERLVVFEVRTAEGVAEAAPLGTSAAG